MLFLAMHPKCPNVQVQPLRTRNTITTECPNPEGKRTFLHISPLLHEGGVRGQARRGGWGNPRKGPDRANPGGVRGETGGWPGKAQRNQWGGVEIVPLLLIRPVSAAFPASESVFDAGGEETGRWFSPGPDFFQRMHPNCPNVLQGPYPQETSQESPVQKKKGPNCKGWGQ